MCQRPALSIGALHVVCSGCTACANAYALARRDITPGLFEIRDWWQSPQCVSALADLFPHIQVRNKERIEELKALGADEVIDVTTEDVVERVKAITGALEQWPMFSGRQSHSMPYTKSSMPRT